MGTTENDEGQYDTSTEIFWASGACMAIKAEAWHKVGGLDGDFFAHMEEIDLCWRLQLLGYKIEIEPRSVVYHVGGGTLPNNSPRKIYLNFRNSLYMLHKCLPEGDMWRLRLRLWLDRFSWAVYVATGKWSFARAVCRAHCDYRKARPMLDTKRNALPHSANERLPQTVFDGWIIWRRLCGKQRFSQLGIDK